MTTGRAKHKGAVYMTQCKYFEDCPANCNSDIGKPMGIIEDYRRTYCKGEPSKCARRKLIEEVDKESLPYDLYPYQHERAEQIINNN